MSWKKINLPFEETDTTESCAQLLIQALQDHAGIASIEVDLDTDIMNVKYNPEIISPKHVAHLATQLGLVLTENVEGCTLRLRGAGCRDCVNRVESKLEQLEDVLRVSVNWAANKLSIEYLRKENGAQTPLANLQQQITALGYVTETETEVEAESSFWQRHHGVLYTAACAVFLAVGWGLQFANVPSWLPLIFFVFSYLAGGTESTITALRLLKSGEFSVDLLMVAAALGAATIGHWEEGAILLFLFSLSHTLEEFAMDRTRNAIRHLVDLRPSTALVIRDGQEMSVAVEQVQVGDRIIIKPGNRIPLDGVVIDGQSAVDQAPITGESIPVSKDLDDAVYAGTINGTGSLEVRVSKRAADSTLAKIIQLVEEAQSERAPTQRFIDRFSQYYTPVILLGVALAIVIPWALGQDFNAVFYRAMVLLVVASPCALVISTPASILAAIANAARHGVLFKGGVYLETMGQIDAVAFDKTGTLTTGKPQLNKVVVFSKQLDYENVLMLAASVEQRSEHPLAQAIVSAAKVRNIDLQSATQFRALPGQGVRAQVHEKTVWVGTRTLIESQGFSITPDMQEAVDGLESQGNTVMWVASECVLGAIAVADQLRAGAAQAIQKMHQIGIQKTIMITGDNQRVAQAMGQAVGVDEVHAELMPEDKVRLIKSLKNQRQRVAMVGDGVNDAPALAASDLGVAMGAAGTDVALETADVVLMADDLDKLTFATRLSRQARRVVFQNIGFSLVVILTLLVTGASGVLSLPLGVIGHEGSTLIVVMNGLRLLRFS